MSDLQERKQSNAGNGNRIDRRTFLEGAAMTMAAYAVSSSFAESASAQDPAPGAVVETTAGKVRGAVHDGIHVYKGIPYGGSTAGENRFMSPTEPIPWTGVRDVLKFGTWSPQNMHYFALASPQADVVVEGTGEDCLVLNVWTPEANSSRKRPVMFWCHGGGFAQESASWPWVNGEALARRGDVVVVSVNHRLNLFGYCYLGDIGGEKYAASGAAGMLDLVLALEWVRDNIAQFGGDPGNVMVFGESGGGAKTATLLAMPKAQGLFHRAGIQSGITQLMATNTRERATASAEALMARLGVPRRRVDEMQKIPPDVLLAAMASLSAPGSPIGGAANFSPFPDGKIIAADPFDPLSNPISPSVPILVGCNSHEQAFFASMGDPAIFSLTEDGLRRRVANLVGEQRAPQLIEMYKKDYPNSDPTDLFLRLDTDRVWRVPVTRYADRKVEQGKAPIYVYEFAWRTSAMGGMLGAPHTVEVPFVFDNTDVTKCMTSGSAADKELAARTSEAWIHFARTGNPNHDGLPHWPAYTQERATMVLNTTSQAVNDPGGEERKFWADLS